MFEKLEELKKFFEDVGFDVFTEEQDGVICAELEMWTDGGVDMIIWLNPFTKESFKEYVKDFDIDELIDLHRQDKRYKDNFTIRQSLKDFESFHEKLKQFASVL